MHLSRFGVSIGRAPASHFLFGHNLYCTASLGQSSRFIGRCSSDNIALYFFSRLRSQTRHHRKVCLPFQGTRATPIAYHTIPTISQASIPSFLPHDPIVIPFIGARPARAQSLSMLPLPTSMPLSISGNSASMSPLALEP
jgi:hypothetical protein